MSKTNDYRNRVSAYNRMRVVNAMKRLYGCACCGNTDGVLEWDHLDPSKKHCNVSEMGTYSWDRILEEIDKCQVLCYECHYNKTFTKEPLKLNEQGWAVMPPHKLAKPVVIDGVTYESQREAARKLGIPRETLRQKLKR